MPTDAEEDCMIAVTATPTSSAIMGLEKAVIRRANSADSASGFIASLIMPMPTNSIPKPATTCPMR